MKTTARLAVLVSFVVLVGGCDALRGLFEFLNPGPTQITIAFVNSSPNFDVEVQFFSSDEQDVPRDVLTNEDLNDPLVFTIPQGQTVSYPRRCVDVKAMVVEDADLLLFPGISPETQSDVVREDQDYECGATITFTFSHSDNLLDPDFQVTVSTTAPAAE